MQNILTIQNKLKKINKSLYIVGGFCRDKIMNENHNHSDIDLVTDALPDEMKVVLKVVGEVGKKYGTAIISEGGESFELTTFREDIGTINHRKPAEVKFTNSLEKDCLRRDFTFNSVYFDLERVEYIDPNGGIQDIKNKIIRFVGNIEDRIDEDALRILRFIRFKNKYGFKVADKKYFEIIKNKINLLEYISIERIKQELDKIIVLKNNIEALQDLKDIGFLKLFLPELDILESIPGGFPHHLEGNVWIHTKMCIKELNKIIVYKKIGDIDRKKKLVWTMLFHDIAKADTFNYGENKRIHYYEHEKKGAEVFEKKISKRLLFENKVTKEIRLLIYNHIKVYLIPEMKKVKARKLMMEPFFEDLLIITEADNRGRIPSKLDRFEKIKKIYLDFKKILKTKRFLNGHDLMKMYPELEGKEIGIRLENLNNNILINDEK